MTIKKSNKNNRLQTRAELINRSRTSIALDRLPAPSKNVFDGLQDFEQGVGKFIDLSSNKSL